MEFLEVSKLFSNLEKTNKRLLKISYLKDFFRKNSQESALLYDLICGNFSREINRKNLAISLKTTLSILSFVSSKTKKDLEKEFNKKGDVGIIAQDIFFSKKQQSFENTCLFFGDIIYAFEKISKISGKKSQEKKENILIKLFFSAKSDLEYKYLARILVDDLRVGVSYGVLKESHFQHFFPEFLEITKKENLDDLKNFKEIFVEEDFEKEEFLSLCYSFYKKKTIIKANDTRKIYNIFFSFYELSYNVLNSFRKIDLSLRNSKLKNLLTPQITLGIPFQPNLGQRVFSFSEALKVIGKKSLADFKYDGIRMQIHNDSSKKKVIIFTRNLEDITLQFPEITNYFQKNFKDVPLVLDCECVAFDYEKKIFLPFQKLSQRILTKNIKSVSHIKICIKTFDITYLNGKTLINLQYHQRRKIMEDLFLNRKLVQEK